MIDPHKTGAYISRLRREKDWTQLELADRLHVTPQAVSRWETGESFPDLALLAQLAQIFRVSVDDLLRGETANLPVRRSKATTGEVIGELALGRPEAVARMVLDDKAEVESVIEAGPLTRPSLMDQVIGGMQGFKFTLQQVAGLAPFIGEDLLDAMVREMDAAQLDADLLSELAPFLGEQALDGLVERVIQGEVPPELAAELAPFMSEAALDRLVQRIPPENLDAALLSDLAPHLGEKTLDRLADQVLHGPLDAGLIADLAPFLGEKTFDRLVNEMEPGDMDAELLCELAPHLGESALERLVNIVIGADPVDAGLLEELVPFLDDKTVRHIFANVDPRSLTPEAIVSIAPHVDKETLARLIRG